MKKMQSVASQDRPKMIAVSVGIVIALGFVARSISGSPILAHSGEAPPAPSAPPVAQTTAAPAHPAAVGDQPLAVVPPCPRFAAAGDSPARFGENERLRLPDPFRPLKVAVKTGVRIASARPAASASSRLEVPPAAPEPAAALARRAHAERAAPEPAVQGAGGSSDSSVTDPRSLSPAAGGQVGDPGVGRFAPVKLVGTVGEGKAAIAVFRVGDHASFLSAARSVAGWRIARIRMGKVWVSRRGIRQTVRVGETLPEGVLPASGPGAVPAG